MIIRFTEDIAKSLLQSPEAGMGYQFVQVTTCKEEIKKGIAYNAELLVFEKEPDVFKVAARYSDLVEWAKSSKETIKSVRVLSRSEVQPTYEDGTFRLSASFGQSRSGGASAAPERATSKLEVFKRFSAYRNDNRITASGGLLPGTYATTEQDAKNAKTGEGVVERYALPNPQSAVHVFTIKPPEKTSVKQGIVQRAFGHMGGGIEVLFANGSPSQTVTGPDTIPAR